MIIQINVSASGPTSIFTPATNRRFRVVGYHLASAGANTVTWKRGTTAFGGAWSFVAGVPHSALPDGMDRVGLFEGDVGEALVLDLGSGVQLSGHIDVEQL